LCASELFDLVLLGNIPSFFPANQVRGILHKVHRTLTFGGLIVVDGALDEERGPAEPVLLVAVDRVNAAPDAEFYTCSHYQELLLISAKRRKEMSR
jgi:hypothetical protein